MRDQENQELNLDDILREFGAAPEEAPVEEPVAEETEAVAEEATPEQPEEEQLEEMDEETLSLWLGGKQEQPAADLGDTRRIDPVELQAHQTDITGDTIRLDGLVDGIPTKPKKDPMLEDTQRIWNPEDTIHARPSSEEWKQGDTIHAEPFSGSWEPEYEQPMGEYVPPQPIAFNPRSRFRELKKKLVEGPEKRYYQLMEKGVGREQTQDR